MLKSKYYRNFKGNDDFLVIIGDSESYSKASAYFKNLKGGALISEYISLEDLDVLNQSQIILTPEECSLFSEMCDKLSAANKASHFYLEVKNVPNLELLISYGEYADLPE